jgi:rhodanese-related sulfurtransferase
MQKSSFITRIVTAFAAVVAVFGLTLGLSGCAPTTIDMNTVDMVIDVRTPAEFSTGHLEGAVNIDWEGTDFAAQIGQLDPTGHYVLYCRSGNRAGQAKAAMEQSGFTHVDNLGGIEQAGQTTGLPVVTN